MAHFTRAMMYCSILNKLVKDREQLTSSYKSGMDETKRIAKLRRQINELTGVLQLMNKEGIFMSLDLKAFRALTDILREMKEELALLESEEIMTTFKNIQSN